MTKATNLLEPGVLGFWVRCIREAGHMSQDALAALSRVDIRTIQRMEVGNAVSITTQRCIARALGYENPDIFDDPEFALEIHKFLEGAQAIKRSALEKEHPDRIRVKAARALNGEALGRLADTSNAVSLNIDDAITIEAKRVAAAMFDYISDLLDAKYDASLSDKLSFAQELETMLRELEDLGAAVYVATRSAKFANDHWTNKEPIPLTIGYLAAVPKGTSLGEMLVPRRFSGM
jgi:hypothetical protein